MKALVGAFNQEKALVGAFSAIVKTDFETDGSSAALVLGHVRTAHAPDLNWVCSQSLSHHLPWAMSHVTLDFISDK